MDALDGVAGAVGDLDQSRASVSPADAGEGRAFPSHAGGRSLARPQLQRLARYATGVRSVASGLSHRAVSRSVEPGSSRESLSRQRAFIPGDTAGDRVRSRRSGPPRVAQGRDQV